ncbi:methyl-accepting chemotaxis protein [Synechocystis sp. LKSZ1]|uniref:methyl-accepting chemotaxis protein n=1 Tax=Synechocystis sp. LKSZ1 TaxID=3144951 RepID=UPI00336BF206
MTATQDSSPKTLFSAEIIELQKAVDQDPNDLIARMSLASALEEGKFWSESLVQYQAVKNLATDETFQAVADKAIADLQLKLGQSATVSAESRRSYRQGKIDVTANATDVSFWLQETALQERQYPEEVVALQQAAAANPSDIVTKIALASALEQVNFLPEAAALYQEIKALDTDQTFSATADQALAGIRAKLEKEAEASVGLSYRQGLIETGSSEEQAALEQEYEAELKAGKLVPESFRQSLLNLPIAYKQFIAFLTCSTISVVGVVGAGMAIALYSGRAQLQSQASAESLVAEINYNIKINQMKLGFRGQAENLAIIQAARLSAQKKPLPADLKEQVRQILNNEIKARNIEYATLVGKDKKIIANANFDRAGETFDPSGLVKTVLSNPQQISQSALITKTDLEKEGAPFITEFMNADNTKGLIRFTATPVQDPKTQALLGVLIAGDLVNNKNSIATDTARTLDGGYTAVYYTEDGKQPLLASSVLQQGKGENATFVDNLPLADLSILQKALKGDSKNLTTRSKVEGLPLTIAVQTIADTQGKPLAFLVRGTPETNLEALLQQTFLLQLGVGILTLIFAAVVASLLGRALTQPLKQLQLTAQRLGAGESGIRAAVASEDEVGQLAKTFNEMADRVETYTKTIEEAARQRQLEAETQRQQKEELQQDAIQLLLDIEEVARGNLTIKSQVQAGAVGSIADAFNATISRLRALVQKVLLTANEVNERALRNRKSVTSLSYKAMAEAKTLETASHSVEEIAASIESVSEAAQNAAMIARQGSQAAQQGQDTMDKTVNSIYKIRGRVAEISKKSKRLAESSQEISKIVGIISGISEKTNLLAFNASIEAARAGENGQGFRIVADEVRRLAEMVTASAQEIEQVILRIQEETTQMTQMMEESTTEVVTGTQLVQTTKETLQNLAGISQEIDQLLASISETTESQRLTSQQVTKKMQNIATVSQKTSERSAVVAKSLEELVAVAGTLEEAAGQFTVD